MIFRFTVFLLTVFAISGCSSFEDEVSGGNILGDWRLTHAYIGTTVVLESTLPQPFMIRFTDQPGFTPDEESVPGGFRFSSLSGCNDFFGSYRAEEDGDFVILSAGSTLMLCGSPYSELEKAILVDLRDGGTYGVADGRLRIEYAGGELVFARHDPG